MATHDDLAAEVISCSECFELLSVGVERELAGTTLAPALTRLAQHLGQCGACRDQFETLRDFVRSEAAGVPSPPGGASPTSG